MNAFIDILNVKDIWRVNKRTDKICSHRTYDLYSSIFSDNMNKTYSSFETWDKPNTIKHLDSAREFHILLSRKD